MRLLRIDVVVAAAFCTGCLMPVSQEGADGASLARDAASFGPDGGDSHPDSGTSTADASDSDGGGGIADAGRGDSDSGVEEDGGPRLVDAGVSDAGFYGAVGAMEWNFSGTPYQYGWVDFRVGPPPSDPGCTLGARAGDCCYRSSLLPDNRPDVSAGDVRFAVNGKIVGTFVFSSGSYVYQPDLSQPQKWLPEDILGAAAAGATVPAFTAKVAAAPALTITAPPGGAQIDRTQDLVVTWAGTSTSNAYVVLDVVGGGVPLIDCSFPNSDPGTVTISKTLLSRFNVGAFMHLTVAHARVEQIPGAGADMDMLSVYLAQHQAWMK